MALSYLARLGGLRLPSQPRPGTGLRRQSPRLNRVLYVARGFLRQVLGFQLGAESLVETVGEVGGRDAQRELHERLRRQMALDLLDESGIHLHVERHLFGVTEHQALEVGVERAFLILGQGVELVLEDTDPLTEGRVVRDSVPASVELRDLDVGELPQRDVERAFPQGRVPPEKRRDGTGVVGHELEDVEDATRALLKVVVDGLHLHRHPVALQIRKPGRHQSPPSKPAGSARTGIERVDDTRGWRGVKSLVAGQYLSLTETPPSRVLGHVLRVGRPRAWSGPALPQRIAV